MTHLNRHTFTHRQRRTRILRRAFTLTELLVSMAILVAMMGMIAAIFATAGKASGRAQSTSKAYRLLLQADESIRADLAAIQPGPGTHTVLAIAGVEISAPVEAGQPPRPLRADVLMVVNRRAFEPFIMDRTHPLAPELASARHVVYGHADFGEIDDSGNLQSIIRIRDNTPSRPPARQWHLARRVTGFPAYYQPSVPPGMLAGTPSTAILTAYPMLSSQADVFRNAFAIGSFNFAGYAWEGFFRFVEGATVEAYFTYPFDGKRYLWDGIGNDWFHFHEGLWYARSSILNWQRTGADHISFPPASISTTIPLPNAAEFSILPPYMFYDPAAANRRTILDLTPPAGRPERLSAYFLPGCVEFKVEYTYDNPREIGLDPLNPEHEVLFASHDADGVPNPSPATMGVYEPAPTPIRWEVVQPGQQMIWSGLSVDPETHPNTSPTLMPDNRDLAFPYRWPRALRITIRAFPTSGSLEQPIVHTIIHAWP